MTCTLQVHAASGDLARSAIDKMLAYARRYESFDLIALAGKPEDKPNILPHNVHFVAPEAAAKDLTTDVLILTGGPLAEQFSLASTAITSGKHVIIADARLLAAYGDILPKMASAYGVQFGVSALLTSQPQALTYLESLRPFGVREIVWREDNPLNTYIEQQEIAQNDLIFQGEAHALNLQHKSQTYQNLALRGQAFGQWDKLRNKLAQTSASNIAAPTAHEVRVARRLGGCLRYVSCVNASESVTGLHFLPQNHALAQQPTGVSVTLENGAIHTLAHTPSNEGVIEAQASALLSDMVQLVQHPRRQIMISRAGDQQTQVNAVNNIMLLTDTGRWRNRDDEHKIGHKANLKADVMNEQLLGTTLIVTLRPRVDIHTTLSAAQALGGCFLLTEARLPTEVPSLRLAV